MSISKEYLDKLAYQINGAAIEVHKALGPGLLESVYHACLKHEFKLRNLSFVSQTVIPIFYKGIKVDAELRYDFLVENCVIVEIKSVESILPIHEAQLLTYMKLQQVPQGRLINFNCTNIFKEGQKSFVNEFYRQLPL
jgi:GxxExxY protein